MTATADPAIAEAVEKVHFFTADEQDQINQLRYEMWLMDQQTRHNMALREGARQAHLEIARGMLAKGLPMETVTDLAQLTPDEVAELNANPS